MSNNQNEKSVKCLNKSYKGFEYLGSGYCADAKCNGVYLRHKKTGLEVFHLLNDDKENLFMFAFRTVPETSNGVPHIIEHTVLCGSEKYPIKDPFVVLENQSVKTFLNAMTFPDKTAYPCATVAEKDYFNLMSVYGDAVFFPKLRKEVFMQEGHHLEIDPSGKYSFQGVVYNEMKGNYSTFDSVANDCIISSLMPDTVYNVDAGGDPLVIPDLTYEQYLDFYKKYYIPENCILFLYGNIPTEKQLDFIQTEFLDRIESRRDASPEPSATEKQSLLNEIALREKASPVTEIKMSKWRAPLSEGKDTDPTVTVNWNLGDVYDVNLFCEYRYLAEILFMNSGSPLLKALTESNLGKGLSSLSGPSTSTSSILFALGLRSVKEKNAQKVKDLIYKTLNEIIENGIPQEDLEAAIMSVDFSTREIVRYGEPYSISYGLRAVRQWNFGKNIFDAFRLNEIYESIKNRLLDDKDYLPSMIKKYFLENKNASITLIYPDKKYIMEREQKEAKKLQMLQNKIPPEEVNKNFMSLKAFQAEADDVSCIPHIKPSELDPDVDNISAEVSSITTESGKKITAVLSHENTNGIIYADYSFPCDVLDAGLYPYIPFFCDVLLESGWKNVSWSDGLLRFARVCQSVGVTKRYFEVKDTEKARAKASRHPEFTGRPYITISAAFLPEYAKRFSSLLAESLQNIDFADLKRLKILSRELLDDYESEILPDGHLYALSRSMASSKKSSCVYEIWNGISQLFTLREIARNPKAIRPRLCEIAQKIFSSGVLVHLTADDDTMDKAIDSAKSFISLMNLKPLEGGKKYSDSEFFDLLKIKGKDPFKNEFIKKQAHVYFASETFKASPVGTRERISEGAFRHWFSMNTLWEKIRMEGGAYGGFAISRGDRFSIVTYRDPDGEASVSKFEECLRLASEHEFDENATEKLVTGAYSSSLNFNAPKGRGREAFCREITGDSSEEVRNETKVLLSLTKDDIAQAAKRLLASRQKASKTVIIGPKLKKLIGNFQKIEL